jgi:hypothetical protein
MFGAIANDDIDDAPALNRMAAQAATTGRPATIPAGTYILNSTLLIRSNLTIIGVGNPVLKAGPRLPPTAGIVWPQSFTAGTGRYAQAHVTLRGLTFDGGGRPFAGQTYLVQLVSIDGLTVTDCLFQNYHYGLLAIGGSRAVTLRRDRFRNWGRADVSSEGGPALWLAGNPLQGDLTPTTGVRAYDLDFRDSEWAAIYLFARDAIFAGGTIRNTKEGGIYSHGVDAGCATTYCKPHSVTNGVEISGYTISHVRRKYIQSAGFEMGGTGLNIHHNIVFDTDGAGIELNWPIAGAKVANNIVYDTVKGSGADPAWKIFDNYGQIELLQRGAPIRNVTITANHIGKAGVKPIARHAIKLDSLQANDRMTNIVATGNDVRFGFARAAYGFFQTPLVPTDRRSRLAGNVGAADLKR